MMERGTFTYLEFCDVLDERRRVEEDVVETFAAILEESRFLLGGCSLERDLCEEMESAGGEPCLGDAGAGAKRGGVVVEVIDDLVY